MSTKSRFRANKLDRVKLDNLQGAVPQGTSDDVVREISEIENEEERAERINLLWNGERHGEWKTEDKKSSKKKSDGPSDTKKEYNRPSKKDFEKTKSRTKGAAGSSSEKKGYDKGAKTDKGAPATVTKSKEIFPKGSSMSNTTNKNWADKARDGKVSEAAEGTAAENGTNNGSDSENAAPSGKQQRVQRGSRDSRTRQPMSTKEKVEKELTPALSWGDKKNFKLKLREEEEDRLKALTESKKVEDTRLDSKCDTNGDTNGDSNRNQRKPKRSNKRTSNSKGNKNGGNSNSDNIDIQLNKDDDPVVETSNNKTTPETLKTEPETISTSVQMNEPKILDGNKFTDNGDTDLNPTYGSLLASIDAPFIGNEQKDKDKASEINDIPPGLPNESPSVNVTKDENKLGTAGPPGMNGSGTDKQGALTQQSTYENNGMYPPQTYSTSQTIGTPAQVGQTLPGQTFPAQAAPGMPPVMPYVQYGYGGPYSNMYNMGPYQQYYPQMNYGRGQMYARPIGDMYGAG